MEGELRMLGYPVHGADKLDRIIKLVPSNYPDGAPLIEMQEAMYIRRLLVQTTKVSELMVALFFVDALRQRGFIDKAGIELVLPFVPGGRQDRLNDQAGDFLFTLRSVAQEINARRFDRVTVVDPHSDVTAALIDRCFVYHSDEILAPLARSMEEKYAAVVSPDAGAEKRASRVAKLLGVPLIHAWKTRGLETGVLTGFGHEDINELVGSKFGGFVSLSWTPAVLVVDDLCDGGGTFIGLADKIREQVDSADLHLDLFVTHGLFTKGTEHLYKKYRRIYCTDSVQRYRPAVLEFEICQKLLEGGGLR